MLNVIGHIVVLTDYITMFVSISRSVTESLILTLHLHFKSHFGSNFASVNVDVDDQLLVYCYIKHVESVRYV